MKYEIKHRRSLKFAWVILLALMCYYIWMICFNPNVVLCIVCGVLMIVLPYNVIAVSKSKVDEKFLAENEVYTVHCQDGKVFLNGRYLARYIRKAKLGPDLIVDMRNRTIYTTRITSDKWMG